MPVKKLPKKRIGEILIEEGYLEKKNLEKALEIQKKEGGLIGGILIREGFVTEENVVEALSKQLLMPYIRLSNYRVNREVLKVIPRDISEKYVFFPFDKDSSEISVAMSDPLNQEALGVIEKCVPLRIQIFLASGSEIKEAIELHYAEFASEA
ncbi:MAG: hypothetical protein HY447_04575 [Candidatus Omnitrophica bacterium]|nr:hypothetical protein [Candidatus Omnitrophota bacterium]